MSNYSSSIIIIKEFFYNILCIVRKNEYFKLALKMLSILIIILNLFVNMPSNKIESFAYSNTSLEYDDVIKYNKFTKGELKTMITRSESLNWNDAQNLILKGENFLVIDILSGYSFEAQRTGGSNHYDIETLTAVDTEILKLAFGGEFTWSRRPMLILYNQQLYGCSAHGMPHAGIDKEPGRAYVMGRSCNYGSGINYDIIKNNNMDGHICIHFINSRTHSSNMVDAQHQFQIDTIEKLKETFLFESSELFD